MLTPARRIEIIQTVLNEVNSQPPLGHSTLVSNVGNNALQGVDLGIVRSIVNDMVTLDLLFKANTTYTLGVEGLKVFENNNANYANYLGELEEDQRREKETKEQHLKLLTKTNRFFYWTSGVGILGGILGAITFFESRLPDKQSPKMQDVTTYPAEPTQEGLYPIDTLSTNQSDSINY